MLRSGKVFTSENLYSIAFPPKKQDSNLNRVTTIEIAGYMYMAVFFRKVILDVSKV